MLLIVFAILEIGGCAKRTSTAVVVCLKDDQGVLEFKELMRSEAIWEQAELQDSSTETQQTLQRIQGPAIGIHMSLKKPNGATLLAANLAMPSNQVMLGFFDGSDKADAQKFANKIIGDIKARWYVEEIPTGTLKAPLENCPMAKGGEREHAPSAPPRG